MTEQEKRAQEFAEMFVDFCEEVKVNNVKDPRLNDAAKALLKIYASRNQNQIE